ncbi:MAG: 8-amino-7-ketopelargonate synthase [Verrucomicrobiaceae bacterium]|nr:8-amino-7-ketopelargonate synthase [Verrucomicrobiaceae bacterium]
MSWAIANELAELEAAGLRRRLRVLGSPQGTVVNLDGREVVNFSSNDYLGLAASAELRAAFAEGVRRYGAGSGASRLVCGGMAPHHELEEALAAFKGTQAALTFSSGFAVALGTIPALMGTQDVIILDKLCHASLVDAARMCGATIRVFPHNHLGKLEKLLMVSCSSARRVLVVTESIFSMDGDAAALAEIVELKERHGAWLMLDEAHGVGVLGPQGRGLAAALGLEQRVELQMGTLSKAFGLSGGYIAASRNVIDLLINKARSFIYTTAPPPALAHAAGVSLKLIQAPEGDRRRVKLNANLQSFRAQGLGTQHTSQSAILPIIIGNETLAMHLSARLLDEGFLIPAIRYPTVARGSARLRLTLSAAHEAFQIEALAMRLRCATAELADSEALPEAFEVSEGG